MKKEKGPAPPPPVVNVPKESIDDKAVPDASIAEKIEEIDKKANRTEVIEAPASTTPEDLSSQPEVLCSVHLPHNQLSSNSCDEYR